MKKAFLLTGILLCVFNGVFAQEFNGAGTAESPYLINNEEDLARLAVLVNEGNTEGYESAAYRLTADIDLADFGADATGWVPIGNYEFPFQGQFDGGNHTIYNLTIKETYIKYAGLFGNVDSEDSEFKNIKFVGGEIQIDSDNTFLVTSYVGFLVGYINGKGIDNCSSTGDVTVTISSSSFSSAVAGGLVGYASSSISNCYATGDIIATASYSSSHVGGLVGSANSFISNCYATGDVTATASDSYYSSYSCAGGLVGANYFSSINDCYATGGVTATASSSYAGGIVGYASSSPISDCYATGDVTATSSHSSTFVGGLVGYTDSSFSSFTISNCYATGDVTAISSDSYYSCAGGLVGNTNSNITASVAANNSVTGENMGRMPHVGSIAGYANQSTDIADCYYKETMVLDGGGSSDAVSGQSATISELTSRAFYANLGWDMDEIWSIQEGISLPKLRAIPEQYTAIDTPKVPQTTKARVYCEGNSIVIAGANTGETVWVYNLSGQLIQTQNIASLQTTIALPRGIYIVKVGEANFKIKN